MSAEIVTFPRCAALPPCPAVISKAELTRRVGIAAQQAQRLFGIPRASRLDRIEAGMGVLGRRLVVSSEAA